jgi:hypothetical protein
MSRDDPGDTVEDDDDYVSAGSDVESSDDGDDYKLIQTMRNSLEAPKTTTTNPTTTSSGSETEDDDEPTTYDGIVGTRVTRVKLERLARMSLVHAELDETVRSRSGADDAPPKRKPPSSAVFLRNCDYETSMTSGEIDAMRREAREKAMARVRDRGISLEDARAAEIGAEQSQIRRIAEAMEAHKSSPTFAGTQEMAVYKTRSRVLAPSFVDNSIGIAVNHHDLSDKRVVALENEVRALRLEVEAHVAGQESISRVCDELKYRLEQALKKVASREEKVHSLREQLRRERLSSDAALEVAESNATAALKAQRSDLDTMVSSANARARVLIQERDAAWSRIEELERDVESNADELRRLRAYKKEREDADAELAAQREVDRVIDRFAQMQLMKRALVLWIRGILFQRKLKTLRLRSERRIAGEYFDAWKSQASVAVSLRNLKSRTDDRVRASVLRHWSLAVELSATGGRVLTRRCLLRWRAAASAERDASDALVERIIEIMARSRARALQRAVFTSWVAHAALAKTARRIALDLLANERGVKSTSSSLERHKARRASSVRVGAESLI